MAADAAERRHARIVPAADQALLDQFEQLALAHEGIGQVQAGEFILMARENAEGLDEPVIQRTVHVELEGADRMGDVLDRVALAVGIIIHRIDAPLVSGPVV